MDTSALKAIFDPSAFSTLSMDQKRLLVHEMCKWPDGATEILHAWTRLELLQILCAELGKERKYTGLSKSKIIEQLLRTIQEKQSKELGPTKIPEPHWPLLENGERTPKRLRKSDHLNRVSTAASGVIAADLDVKSCSTVYCKNSACKAKLSSGEEFCKRCSCCICRKYDDNKDPSLWLICNTDSPFHGVSCGMSCHLECTLRHENSGISQDKGLDGSFCCVSCGKINDLLSSWRKQLVAARDTRRVDILGYRLSLGQKILAGTKNYRNLYGIIDEAVKKLEEEVGPLTGLPVKRARGIVNRLSSGPEIQRICAFAVESLDLILSNRVSDMPSGYSMLASKLVRFEDIRATSLTVNLCLDDSNTESLVGYTLWHRKADELDYLVEPTCRLFEPNTKFLLSDLIPATHYFLKVAILNTGEMGLYEFQFQTAGAGPADSARNANSEPERSPSPSQSQSQSPATNCSTLSNPSSIEDETKNITSPGENRGGNHACPITDGKNGKINVHSEIEKSSVLVSSNNMKPLGNPNRAQVPISLECTPSKFDTLKDESKDVGPERRESSWRKRDGKRCEKGIGDKGFEYYVKAIGWLECKGYIETGFREKLLSWYSLRASPREARVVRVFVDTFIDDPESLAAQLVDTFLDVISNEPCMKLWH